MSMDVHEGDRGARSRLGPGGEPAGSAGSAGLADSNAYRPQRIHTEHAGRWLHYRVAEYRDPTGRTRCWEYVERTGDTAAAVVAAVCEPSGDIVLVRQFRAAMQADTIEFPAGLVDPGESPAEAGTRELLEETGLTGEVRKESPVLCTSPGLTSERAYLVEVVIDEHDERNARPRPQRAGDEAITVWRVPASGAERALKDVASEGVVVDSRVWSWIRGRTNTSANAPGHTTPRKDTGA